MFLNFKMRFLRKVLRRDSCVKSLAPTCLEMTSGESGVSLETSRPLRSCLDRCGCPVVTVGNSSFESAVIYNEKVVLGKLRNLECKV